MGGGGKGENRKGTQHNFHANMGRSRCSKALGLVAVALLSSLATSAADCSALADATAATGN